LRKSGIPESPIGIFVTAAMLLSQRETTKRQSFVS
jgi:hypothetical protein